jgi:hypothetical protein
MLAQVTEIANAMKDNTGNYSFIAFLVVSAICFGIAVWAIFNRVWQELLIPLRDRSFKHLDQVGAHMDSVGVTMEAINGALQEVSKRLPAMEIKIDTLGEHMANVRSRVEHIERNVIVNCQPKHYPTDPNINKSV